MTKAQTDSQLSDSAERDRQLRRAELIISTVLRVGVLSSVLVIALGVVLEAVHHPGTLASAAAMEQIRHPGAFPHSIKEIAAGLLSLKGSAVIALGLLLLIATPVLRVATSLLIFTAQKDRLFTLITAAVLALLLLSFFLGSR